MIKSPSKPILASYIPDHSELRIAVRVKATRQIRDLAPELHIQNASQQLQCSLVVEMSREAGWLAGDELFEEWINLMEGGTDRHTMYQRGILMRWRGAFH